MTPREMWEEAVRQMRESPEFQDAGVMYAQGEIERLKEENERLEAAFLAEHQAAVDQFGTAEDLRDENERLTTWVEKAKDAMDDAIHTLQNADEKNWVLGSIDLLNATLKSAPNASHQTAGEE